MSQAIHAVEEGIHAVRKGEERAANILYKLCMPNEHESPWDSAGNRFSGSPQRAISRDEGGESLQNIRKSLSRQGSQDSVMNSGHWLVDSIWFNVFIMTATLLNTLQMGVETDHPEWATAWLICENVFTAIFAVEMVIKLYVFKYRYFSDKANQLDGCLAVLGVIDVWILAWMDGVNLQSLSILRILRLLRLARILRLVRRVKPLVLVIQGVVHALYTSIYVFAVCIFIFYVFAIFLTEHLGKSNTQIYPGYSSDPEVIDEQDVIADYNPHVFFGSMFSSMLTLFNMATFTEWGEIIRPVAIKQPMYLPVFMFFALSVGFGVMNVLIGVIVDVVTAESKRIEERFQDKVKKEKLQTLDRIQEMLTEIDINGDGMLDLEELGQALKDTRHLKSLIGKINLPSGWSSDELLDMLDNNGDGVLTHPEFTTSFYRLLDSDDFQQICILQASINQVKHLLRDQNKYFGAMLSSIEQDTSLMKEALGLVIERQGSFEEGDGSGIQTAAEIRGQSAGSCRKKPRQSHKKGESNGVPQRSDADCKWNTENELMCKMQLLVKECIHKEFAAIRSSLVSDVRCSQLEAKVSSKEHCGSEVVLPIHPCPTNHSHLPIGLPAGCSFPTEDLSDGETDVRSTHTFQSLLPENVPTEVVCAIDDCPKPLDSNSSGTQQDIHGVSESPHYTHPVKPLENDASGMPSLQQDVNEVIESLRDTSHENCGNLGNDEQLAAISTAEQPGHHTAPVEGLDLSAFHSEYEIHDFVFQEGTGQLGFEVHWVQDRFPLIGAVLPGGAAKVSGVLAGDQLAECNGMSLDGRDRQEVLQLLATRPLQLRMLRR